MKPYTRPLVATCLLMLSSAAAAVTCQNGIPASNPDSVYTDHGDGTVTDNRTGLMWKQCAQGQSASGGSCTGSATNHSWSEALSLADVHVYADHSDWRLPNIKELRSLVEECRLNPTINDTLFSNTPGSYFWSGSPHARYSDQTWGVYFYRGDASGYYRSDNYHVRLVRGGQ